MAFPGPEPVRLHRALAVFHTYRVPQPRLFAPARCWASRAEPPPPTRQQLAKLTLSPDLILAGPEIVVATVCGYASPVPPNVAIQTQYGRPLPAPLGFHREDLA